MAEERKWQGKASAKLLSATADQIWPLLEDYCNLHKWLSIIDTCRHVQGTPGPGIPGCVRYCAGPGTQSHDGVEGSSIWANERLLSIDSNERCLSYEITESNMGFENYVATIKVSSEGNGCKIEWSYVTDPLKGWNFEGLVSTISSSLQDMAKNMEEALKAD